MKAFVKSISNDLVDLSSWEPNDDAFIIDIRVEVGLVGTPAADNFDLNVCTPNWLMKNLVSTRWGAGLLIVDKFDFKIIGDFIVKHVSECEGETWEELVLQLRRFMQWEFDGYR